MCLSSGKEGKVTRPAAGVRTGLHLLSCGFLVRLKREMGSTEGLTSSKSPPGFAFIASEVPFVYTDFVQPLLLWAPISGYLSMYRNFSPLEARP